MQFANINRNIPMKIITLCVTAASMALLVASAPALDSIYNKAEEKQLIATLHSPESPQADKVLACKKLAVVGSKESIAALAALLSDEKLSHMARYGLEPMQEPEAGQALRDALGKVKGKLLVGVINSLGARRDPKAVDALAALLGDPDAAVAGAAAGALGRIGDAASAGILQKAIANVPSDKKQAFGDACVRCVEQLTAAGHGDIAASLADATRNADLPGHIRLAATRGAILARGAEGVTLLVETLKSSDWPTFALGLRVARELKGESATKSLVDAMPTLAIDRHPAFIMALADRADKAAIAPIAERAKESPPATRIAAIQALGRIGDASAVPVLLTASSAGQADVADAAKTALVTIKDPGAQGAMIAAIQKEDAAAKRIAIQVLGDRHAAAAAPELKKLLADANDDIRAAAIEALGKCAAPADIPALTAILIQPKQPRDAGLADAALRSACGRLPEKDPVAIQILAALPNAQGPAKSALLRLLSATGGKKALDALRTSLKDPDAQVQDSALRALGEWSDPDAAPALLELAKTLPDEKQRVLALRGYVRLTENNSLTDEQKVAMCKDAMAAAGRDEERKLFLGALNSIGTAEAMQQIVPLLDSPTLKEEAGAAIVAITDKLANVWWRKNDPKPLLDALEKVAATCQNEQTVARANAVLNKQSKGKAKKK